jgi:hypothetical protein
MDFRLLTRHVYGVCDNLNHASIASGLAFAYTAVRRAVSKILIQSYRCCEYANHNNASLYALDSTTCVNHHHRSQYRLA